MSDTESRSGGGESTALSLPNIEGPVAARRARFYAAAPGWEVTHSDDGYGLVEVNGIRIGLGKLEGLPPSPWADVAGAKRLHLDLRVDHLDEASESRGALGASQPDFQAGAGRRRALLDTDGQPFCLRPGPLPVPWRPS